MSVEVSVKLPDGTTTTMLVSGAALSCGVVEQSPKVVVAQNAGGAIAKTRIKKLVSILNNSQSVGRSC